MLDENDTSIEKWSFKKKIIAQVLWMSFLCASIGFFIIFGVIDPGSLDLAFSLHFPMTRELGYGLGFVFLFLICLLASGLTAWMLYNERQKSAE